jgi:hypothetical protein
MSNISSNSNKHLLIKRLRSKFVSTRVDQECHVKAENVSESIDTKCSDESFTEEFPHQERWNQETHRPNQLSEVSVLEHDCWV